MPDPTPPAPENHDRIEDLQIETELQDSYLTYAMSTIVDRALPDVRDGLKPSQRRIMVAMNDLNLGPRSKRIKCAKVVGDTSGNYHPHGDAVIYPTLVRLGQDWNIRYPFVDPQGNFGSSDGDPAAAMRYTEARMTAPAMEMMADLNLDTVNFQPNYDERPGMDEPMVLPGKFPNLLVNGSTGIAVGMACNHAPHNLREICDAIVAVLDNPEIQLSDLMQIVPGPDFPTGGVICGRDGIIEAYKNGRGRLCLRAKLEVEEDKKGRKSVVVTQIPYGVIRKNIVEAVADAVKDGRITDVSAVNDESGREHAVRIVVDLKRDGDAELVQNQLYEFTQCQITVSMINIALVNRQPRTMGIKELIQHFIAHRFEVITRRTKFLLKKAQQRGHILEGLIYAVLDIDEVVRLIRSSKTREEAIEKLRTRAFRIAPDHPGSKLLPETSQIAKLAGSPVNLSQAQAEAIGRLQLIQLVGLEMEKLVSEYKEVVEEIEGYEFILRDPKNVYDIIREDTIEMKEKYGDDRRTEITGDVSGYNIENLIAREDMAVTISHGGYVKRLPVVTYRSQGRGGRGVRGAENKENDFVEHLFVANTHDHLLFFTNLGRVFDKRVYELPEGARTSQGRSLANLLAFQQGEKVASVLTIKDFSQEEQFLMFATAKGTVKKTALSAYANIRQNGLIAIGLDEGDKLIGVAVTSGKDHIMLGTKTGLAIRFEESDVRAMGRPAGGVIGAKFKRDGDEVIDMIVVPADSASACCVLTGCANGYGKRTDLSEYPVKGRGTQGVINIDAGDRNGEVVGMKLVRDTDDVIFMTEKGIVMRTPVAEIRQTGRNAAGVRLLKLDEGDKLVALAVVEHEETDGPAHDAPAPEGATPAPDAPPVTPASDASA